MGRRHRHFLPALILTGLGVAGAVPLPSWAQRAGPPPDPGASQRALSGSIDIHVHSAPDNVPRSIDGLDVAKLARTRGMRGIVLKNHYEPTASLAVLARKEAPGLEVFGGIDLNLHPESRVRPD